MGAISQLELTKDNQELVTFLIADEKEEQLFMDSYWGNEKRQHFSVFDFRMYKLSKININVEQFQILYEKDPINALETLFQHPVHAKHLKLLNKRINNNHITLNELYDLHKQNPEYKLLRLIL